MKLNVGFNINTFSLALNFRPWWRGFSFKSYNCKEWLDYQIYLAWFKLGFKFKYKTITAPVEW